jgi:hypothetical protein
MADHATIGSRDIGVKPSEKKVAMEEDVGRLSRQKRLKYRVLLGAKIAPAAVMRKLLSVFLFVASLSIATDALAVPYYYVDWTEANIPGGTAAGVITLPDLSTVNVTFEAITAAGGPGNLGPTTQTGCGTNYWSPSTPYTSTQVDNPPPDCDIVSLIGGENQTYIVTLSEPIKDPIMAVLSLGQPSVFTTYDFDSPFEIVSQGAGFWGGSDSSLVELANDVLQGNEGHGTLQFIGTFTTFSWIVPTPENWHGFTFGIRTTERIEPDPTAVPEPASMLLLLGGLTAGGVRSRFARKRSK